MLDSNPISNDELAELIRQAIAASPKTKAEIAELLGVSPQAVTGWEKNGRIGKKTLAGLALLTGHPMEHFLSRGRPHKPAEDWDDVRAYSQAAGLSEGAEIEEYVKTHSLKFRAESLARKRLNHSRLGVLYGKGDSMEPRIHSGDAILFDESDTTPRDGHIYVILVPGAGAESYSVKRCQMVDDLVLFVSDNPKGDHNWKRPRRMDDPKKPIKVIGRVRWIGSWEG